MGDETYAVSLYHLCKAIGVEHVYEVNAFDLKTLEETIKREVARDEVSVIITKSPCVLLKSNKFTKVCVADPNKCKKCGMCQKPACPALSRNADGTVTIDDVSCNGCGLCMSLCKFGAIDKVDK